jgi:asparagine synthase (glutamine-hydrolysing)
MPHPSGTYGSRIYKGHKRLSMIDLSDAGKQPKANADGALWVTYDGEIYYFVELQAKLCAWGYHGLSRTGTEALLTL